MKHHTKDKGDLGVAKAIADLTEKGYIVLIPFTEHSPFDLVIYKEDQFYRIQVKYRKANKNGSLIIEFKSNWTDKHGVHRKDIDKSRIDYFCIYCPNTGLCYYFDSKKYNKSLSLRIDQSKNNQDRNIHWAKDFTIL
jgi:hypothetical protein